MKIMSLQLFKVMGLLPIMSFDDQCSYCSIEKKRGRNQVLIVHAGRNTALAKLSSKIKVFIKEKSASAARTERE